MRNHVTPDKLARRRGRSGALTLCAAAVGLLVGSGPASAAYLHPGAPTAFGPDGTSGTAFSTNITGPIAGLAIDQMRDRLYAYNNAESSNPSTSVPRMYGFDISTPGIQAPLSGFPFGAPPAGSIQNAQLAVDNSPGAAGDIYHISAGGVVQSFTPSGIARPGFPVGNGSSFEVEVDTVGNPWATNSDTGKVDQYTTAGKLLRSVNTFEQGIPRLIAFDRATDDMYIGSTEEFWRYTSASNYTVGTPLVSGSFLGGEDVAFDPEHKILYVVRNSNVTAYDAAGGVVETFGSGLGNNFRSIAFDEATGAIYVSQSINSGKILVFAAVVVPDVTTGNPIGDATVSGRVDLAGGGEITDCYFQFGTTKSYGSTVPCAPAIPPNYAEATEVSAELPGVIGETTYHYRLVASNANGTYRGVDKKITPHHVHSLKTQAATDLDRTSATLNASFEGTGEETNYYFEWGQTSAYGNASAAPPGESAGVTNGDTQLSFPVSGLQAGTTYHYRVVATNGKGTSFGNDRTFTTLPAVLDLSTDPASDVAPRTATLNGSFTGTSEETEYFFEWGKTDEYGNQTPPQSAGSTSGATPLSAALSGLELETIYHYRVVAANSLGTSFGEDRTFTTEPAIAALRTEPASDISLQSITLNGSFQGNGDETFFYFEWGETESYGNRTSTPPGVSAGSPFGETEVSAALTDFVGFTTYHYRLVATNSTGTTFGSDRTFTTPPALVPEIDETAASHVSQSSATLHATITPNRWPTAYLFEYGPTPQYGSSTLISDPIGYDLAGHPVSEKVADLAPNTTYHFRAVAINFAGTSNGADQTFTTPAIPGTLRPVAPPPAVAPPPSIALPPSPKDRCARIADRARLNSDRAKRLQRKAARAESRRLRRRSARIARRARRLSRKAKACRRSTR